MKRNTPLSVAREAGEKYYFSGKPCIRGHKSKRLTSTQQCCKCLHERKKSLRKDGGARKKSTVKRNTAKNLGLVHYFTGKPCKSGHVSNRLVSTRQCTECLALRVDTRATINRPLESRRRSNAKRRKRAALIKQRKYQSETLYRRDSYRLCVFMRGCLRRCLGYKKTHATATHLGYSSQRIKERIEFNFMDGMSWSNYGEWHIDHIKPISRFLAQGVTEPAVINALCNLRPCWAKDNLSKGSSF